MRPDDNHIHDTEVVAQAVFNALNKYDKKYDLTSIQSLKTNNMISVQTEKNGLIMKYVINKFETLNL